MSQSRARTLADSNLALKRWAGAEIEDAAGVAVHQKLQRGHMRRREIGDMDGMAVPSGVS
jgi:hypothetical protein